MIAFPPRPVRPRPAERGIALILAIIVIFILTVLGLALLFTTTTEFQIAGAETTLNKAFYAADSGVQYALAQGRLGSASGPCTVNGLPGYWCFNVFDHSTVLSGGQPSQLTVNVTPFRVVDFKIDPGSSLNIGQTPLFDVGYHFDSQSSDPTLTAQKTISVDFTVGPVPFSIPNR